MTDHPASSTPEVNHARLHKAIRQRLESLKRAGLTHLPSTPEITSVAPSLVSTSGSNPGESDPIAAPAVLTTQTNPVTGPDSTAPTEPTPDTPMPNQQQIQLDVIAKEVAACSACQELADTRNLTVFGVGNPNARLVFYGEAPGADEDRQGEPFVGRAGNKLYEIIQAMGIQREDVYILNTIKCRPPGNRNPSPEEQENCSGFLKRQLEIIQPEYIVCLGAVAAKSFLQVTTAIGELRGTFHMQNEIKVLCTYHPAYILRNPAKKRDVWEDIKFLMRDMGLTIPKQYL